MSISKDWRTYLQVNIYGKTLEESREELNEFLSKIGCEKYWMGDIPIVSVEETEDTEGKSNSTPPPSWSTTIADVKFPPCSTPISSKKYPSFGNFSKILSNFNENDEFSNSQIQKFVLRPPITRHRTRSLSVFRKFSKKSKNPLKKRKSAFSKFNFSLKTNEKAAVLETLINIKLKPQNVQISDLGEENVDFPEQSEQFQSADNSFDDHEVPNYENPMELDNPREDDFTGIVDHEEEVFDEEETLPIENYEEIREEENEEEEEGEDEEIPEENFEEEKPLKKRVSFAIPLVENPGGNHRDIVKIRCHFENCEKSYNWCKKYGKTRLVDHAFSHVPNLELKCNLCEYVGKGIRNIRNHHKKVHRDQKLDGFGIRNVVNSSRRDFSNIWELCYKKNENFPMNNDTLSPIFRLDKGIKRRKLAAENDGSKFQIR